MIKAPTVAELLIAKNDSVADESKAPWYNSYSQGISDVIEMTHILDRTIFTPGSVALGIELGMRVMYARQLKDIKGRE